MRRRVHYATWVVCFVSVLWAGVVCVYSVGRDRECRRLRRRVDALESSVDAFPRVLGRATNELSRAWQIRESSNIQNSQYFAASVVDDDDDETAAFVPRVVNSGRTKSRVAWWFYQDVETSPGHVERRYVFRLPFPDDSARFPSVGAR